MEESPLVSVVTPSYNHGKFIETAIESVLYQTYKNIEYFIIDDGSTDDSREIIQTLSAKCLFYFESQSNMGLVPTMNKLIKMCKGKYIAIIESDDIWTLDKIQKQVVFMETHPEIGACGGNVLHINEENEILPNYFQSFKRYKEFHFKDFLSLNYYMPSLSVLMRKDILDKVGLFDEKIIHVDYFSLLGISHNNYQIALLPDLLGFYRVHESNTSKKNKEMFKSKLYLINQYKGNSGYYEGLVKAYLHYFIHKILRIVPKHFFPFKRI